jgi:hypothetical protein
MSEVNLDELKLEDLLFLVGGLIFQGSTAEDIDVEILLKLEELLNIKIDERLNGVPVNAVIH